MKTYKVKHNGNYKTHPTKEYPEGQTVTYKAGVPVELPEEAVIALGKDVEETDEPVPGGRKAINNPFNKMVGNGQAANK